MQVEDSVEEIITISSLLNWVITYQPLCSNDTFFSISVSAVLGNQCVRQQKCGLNILSNGLDYIVKEVHYIFTA